jgi:membrane protease YdiL (CAAX protease family)
MRMTSIFFLLTFALSWASWYAAAALGGGAVGNVPVYATALVYLGTFAPAIVAIAMTRASDGKSGVRALLARLFQIETSAKWYLFAILFMITVKLIVAALHRVAFGEWPVFGSESIWLMFGATAVSFLLLGQAGEEVGWRGYVLPRLASRVGLPWASLGLGVIWAAWHLPLFFLFTDADKHGQSFPLYLLQVTALSVTVAWVWWKTGGSLTLTMLLHAAVNNTKDIVPSVSTGATDVWGLSASRPAWLTVAVLWVLAIGFLFDMRGARGALSRPT